jgi:TatD DNase family protein
MTSWFDSHCHVQEEYLGDQNRGEDDGEAAGDLPAVLKRAREAGVDRLVCIGTGPATSILGLVGPRRSGQEQGDPEAWASIGQHPHEASEGTGAVAELLEREMAQPDGRVVAVGECGLDYYYEHSPRPAQRICFAAQIALAHAYGLALVIHARDAWDDLFDILAAEGVPERTILHCFTGGPDEVDRCLRAGMYVSFSGIVTFKNAGDVRAAVERCPLDRLLIETDSPFLAPVPHRGARNEPGLLPFVGAAVAAIKGCAVEEVAVRSAEAATVAFALSA